MHSSHKDSRAMSVRSGVFGGFNNQSNPSSQNPSFRGEHSARTNQLIPLQKALDNNEKLQKLATQRHNHHKRMDTFGGGPNQQIYSEHKMGGLQMTTESSSGEKQSSRKMIAGLDISIVSGSDEEEVMQVDPAD